MNTLTGKVDREALHSERAPGEGAMEKIGGNRGGRWGKRLVGRKSKEMYSTIAVEIQPSREEGRV